MRLYLIRHGIAIDREDPLCPPDIERFLTKKGEKATRKAMFGLRTLGVRADAILSSSYVRATQTARIAAEALGFAAGKIRHTRALEPDSAAANLFEELGKMEEERVVCCGHAPNLDEVLAFAVGAPSAFTHLKKAGAACLQFDEVQRGEGILLWLHSPRILRSFGR
jgi:phosphohistidine phosphatase